MSKSKKRKLRRNMNTKDDAIYEALRNPAHTTSIIDGNGIKLWLQSYEFISALHRSIKRHKKHLSAEKAGILIRNYEMPAIQRCLQMVLIASHGKGFSESDLYKYIARKFEHITLGMLGKDYQTEEASKFKEDYEKAEITPPQNGSSVNV
jgi:hypothetical protein